jgi:signal transduction histidine kinase
LAIADQLLRQDLGGSLRVVGLPGPGTRFEIRLPLSAPPAR